MNTAPKLPAVEDWHPADIKAALEKKGVTFADIAWAEGLARRSPADVLRRGWRRIEAIVSELLGVPSAEIWPSRYRPTLRPAGRLCTVAERPAGRKGQRKEAAR